jgi:hypothetical protein
MTKAISILTQQLDEINILSVVYLALNFPL